MKKKHLALVSIAVIIISGSIIYFNSNTKQEQKIEVAQSEYNLNPDVSKKVVGSEVLLMEKISPSSIDQITDDADLVVIGKVISGPVDTEIDFPFDNEDMKKSALEASKGKMPKVALACSKIKIEEILQGESSSDIITLAQFGKSTNDNGETKVKEGNRMILSLQRHPDDPNKYSSTNAEEGLFIIDDNGKTLSMSDNKFTSRYDGIDYNILKRDMKNGKKKEKNK